MATETSNWTLAELAARAGVPGRTIRFYIARGLLPGPSKAGRGAAYGPEHLERLRQIRDWQAQGLTLSEVGQRLAGPSRAALLPEPAAWWHYVVADDVTVLVRADAGPWRLKQIKNYLAQMAAGLRADDERKEQQ
jgi:DNA-binding transcriptional MerR regulator